MSAQDRLDAASIQASMHDTARAAFASIEAVDAIDSTNSELLRRRTPDSGIVALFADTQRGGRGRHGRAWTSPPGANLYLSLARRFSGDLARLGGLSLVVGVAVAETMRALGAASVGVKWPNDLVVDDAGTLRKLGGVLIEGALQDGQPRAIVGIGLNVRMPAEAAADIDQPWIDLHELLGADAPSRDGIAATLLTSLADALECFDADGLAPFLPRYAALDVLHGTQVSATVSGHDVVGIAEGIADDGGLRLRTPDGLLTLRAGEVSVRRRPDSRA